MHTPQQQIFRWCPDCLRQVAQYTVTEGRLQCGDCQIRAKAGALKQVPAPEPTAQAHFDRLVGNRLRAEAYDQRSLDEIKKGGR